MSEVIFAPEIFTVEIFERKAVRFSVAVEQMERVQVSCDMWDHVFDPGMFEESQSVFDRAVEELKK